MRTALQDDHNLCLNRRTRDGAKNRTIRASKRVAFYTNAILVDGGYALDHFPVRLFAEDDLVAETQTKKGPLQPKYKVAGA